MQKLTGSEAKWSGACCFYQHSRHICTILSKLIVNFAGRGAVRWQRNYAMKKSDIKRGTIYIIGFVIIAFIMINVLRKPPVDHEEDSMRISGALWSDTLANAASDIPGLAAMDSEITRFMQKWELKGVSFAVTRNDSLLYAKGYGWADMEAGKRMEATSIMRMASASKLVTAVAVMRLIENGRLTLDTKVFGPDGILKDTAFTNAIRDPRITDITIDHLLRHKAGFTRRAGDPMFNTKDIMAAKKLTSPPDNHQLTRIVLGRRLGFSPGTGRQYNNFGYMILSLVIERVSGMSYWDYVQKAVLQPAGIQNFRPATNYYADKYPNETRYYAPDNELVEEFNGSGRMVSRVYGGSNFNGLMGSGGWVSSAADLARLVAAIDKHPGVPDVIRPESVETLTQYSDSDKMSRGWVEVDANGKWTRTGTLSSTHALIERYPEGDCWVFLTNSGVWTGHRFSNDLSRLIDRLRQRYGSDFPNRNLW